MDWFSIALLLVAFALGAALAWRGKPAPAGFQPAPPMPPATAPQTPPALALEQETRFVEAPRRAAYRLLNDSEQALYHRLREAMPNMIIFSQVGVAQLALLRGRKEARRLTAMAGRGVDFIICGADFSIIAAIEIAWPTADADSALAEDEKREALQSLGIPLIVFRPNKLPDADSLSREIADAIIRRKRLEAERE
jgi:hypothetical protein